MCDHICISLVSECLATRTSRDDFVAQTSARTSLPVSFSAFCRKICIKKTAGPWQVRRRRGHLYQRPCSTQFIVSSVLVAPRAVPRRRHYSPSYLHFFRVPSCRRVGATRPTDGGALVLHSHPLPRRSH